ncbi:MAG: hypothetical protein AAB373_06320 [Patescibacteria group bacterium]
MQQQKPGPGPRTEYTSDDLIDDLEDLLERSPTVLDKLLAEFNLTKKQLIAAMIIEADCINEHGVGRYNQISEGLTGQIGTTDIKEATRQLGHYSFAAMNMIAGNLSINFDTIESDPDAALNGFLVLVESSNLSKDLLTKFPDFLDRYNQSAEKKDLDLLARSEIALRVLSDCRNINEKNAAVPIVIQNLAEIEPDIWNLYSEGLRIGKKSLDLAKLINIFGSQNKLPLLAARFGPNFVNIIADFKSLEMRALLEDHGIDTNLFDDSDVANQALGKLIIAMGIHDEFISVIRTHSDLVKSIVALMEDSPDFYDNDGDSDEDTVKSIVDVVLKRLEESASKKGKGDNQLN